MKVSGCVFQSKNIFENTSEEFHAKYKGKEIIITSDHGHGEPSYKHLKRFDVVVIDIKTGMYDVFSYEDVHTIQDAIRYALKGSMLIQ